MPGPWSEAEAALVASAARGTLISGPSRAVFSGLSTDSRTLRPGELFVALDGGRYDGHDFVLKAIGKQAAGILVREAWWREHGHRVASSGARQTAVITVPEPLRALGDLANWWRRRNRVVVLAVTGSVGKTTAKEMAAAIFCRRHAVLKTEGNLNNLIGLPLTLLGLEKAHERAVLEMGMNRPGEISRLTEIAEPDAGLITNVGMAHLEGLGSLEAVARAKAELVEMMPPRGRAVLNGDDDLLMRTASPFRRETLRFGLGPRNDVRAEGIVDEGRTGVAFELVYGRGKWPVRLGVAGRHNVLNALGAAAAALALGERPEDVAAGLGDFAGLHGRFHVRTLALGIVLVDDTYNANPTSLQAGLGSLRGLAGEGGRIIVALGDMLELGQEAGPAHRDAGRRVAEIGASELLVMGDHAPEVIRGAIEAGMAEGHVARVPDQDEMASRVYGLIKANDLVYFKGSRRMALEKAVERFVGLLEARERT